MAAEFLKELNATEGTDKRFSQACLERLRQYQWPGNVRELRNVVQRAFILADEDVGVDSLSLGVSEEDETPVSSLTMRVGTSLSEVERQLILATLDRFGGNKAKVAEVLGISLKTLYNRLREYKSE